MEQITEMIEEPKDPENIKDSEKTEEPKDSEIPEILENPEKPEPEVPEPKESEIIKPPEPTIYTEFCFSGACNRGICYLGAMKYLEEHKLADIKKIVGVSIGSFIGAGYIIGYTTDDMYELIINKDTKEFKDLRGKQYHNWVREVLAYKVNPDITLKDLYTRTGIEFVIIATCIYSPPGSEFEEGIVYLSHLTHPTFPLITAILASMSFPFIFSPITYKECQFVDGGVLDNFPLDQVSEHALGIKVQLAKCNGALCNRNPFLFVEKMFELVSQRIKQLSIKNTNKVVNIKCEDFTLISFDMNIDDKITLFKRGYNSMKKEIESMNN